VDKRKTGSIGFPGHGDLVGLLDPVLGDEALQDGARDAQRPVLPLEPSLGCAEVDDPGDLGKLSHHRIGADLKHAGDFGGG
jgi:hypothetical protein